MLAFSLGIFITGITTTFSLLIWRFFLLTFSFISFPIFFIANLLHWFRLFIIWGIGYRTWTFIFVIILRLISMRMWLCIWEIGLHGWGNNGVWVIIIYLWVFFQFWHLFGVDLRLCLLLLFEFINTVKQIKNGHHCTRNTNKNINIILNNLI